MSATSLNTLHGLFNEPLQKTSEVNNIYFANKDNGTGQIIIQAIGGWVRIQTQESLNPGCQRFTRRDIPPYGGSWDVLPRSGTSRTETFISPAECRASPQLHHPPSVLSVQEPKGPASCPQVWDNWEGHPRSRALQESADIFPCDYITVPLLDLPSSALSSFTGLNCQEHASGYLLHIDLHLRVCFPR